MNIAYRFLRRLRRARLDPVASAPGILPGLVTAVGLSVSQLAIPVVIGGIVDHALLAKDASVLILLCGGLVVLAATTSVCQVLHELVFARRGETALRTLQKEGLRRVLIMPTLAVEKHRAGRLHSLLVQDAPTVASLQGRFLGQTILVATQVVGIVVLLFGRYGAASLVALGLIPAYLVVPRLMIRRVRDASKSLSIARSEVSTMLQESIQAASDLRAYGRESWAAERLDPLLRHRLQRRLAFILSSSSEWVNYTLAFLVGAGVYWLGGQQVLGGRMSVGELVTLVAILGYLEGPVGRATRLWGELQGIHASRERLDTILDSPVILARGPGTRPMPPGPVRVRFHDVLFRYDANLAPALGPITFTVEPGEMVAIVGSSGAGKSTLAKLLLRLYLPERGKIEINGHPIQEYDEHTFRAALGFIPQDPVLFPGTVRENILLGREAGRRDLENAARLANAHRFIRGLPQGYDTVIGDRGVGLSGGQRQRLAIARAVIGNPGLIVLDEATSALDSKANRAVERGLQKARRNRTTFVITHRPTTVQECDRTLVLERGRLVAFGRHGHVVESSGPSSLAGGAVPCR